MRLPRAVPRPFLSFTWRSTDDEGAWESLPSRQYRQSGGPGVRCLDIALEWDVRNVSVFWVMRVRQNTETLVDNWEYLGSSQPGRAGTVENVSKFRAILGKSESETAKTGKCGPMVARRVISKIELLAIAFVATAAIGGRWAGAAEHVSAALQPESQDVATETIGYYGESSAPVWYFGADALMMKRDGVSSRAFASLVTRSWAETSTTTSTTVVEVVEPDDTTTTTTTTTTTPVWTQSQTAVSVLGPQDLDFGYRGGWKAIIGRAIGERSAMEVSYFGLSDWSDTRTVIDSTPFQFGEPPAAPVGASLFSPFTDLTGDPVAGLDYNNLARISYSSDLYGLEWNLRRQLYIPEHWVRGSVLIGGRYMDLGESFSYYSESAYPGAATNSVNTSTGNDLVGVQVGAEFNFQVEPQCWIDCEIKGGIFDNAASQDTVYVNQSATAYNGTHTGSRAENTSAFALDLSLNLTYECNSFTTLRIGYQAFWLEGLALASENVASSADVLVSGAANLVNDGKVVYHGPRLGITCAW